MDHVARFGARLEEVQSVVLYAYTSGIIDSEVKFSLFIYLLLITSTWIFAHHIQKDTCYR